MAAAEAARQLSLQLQTTLLLSQVAVVVLIKMPGAQRVHRWARGSAEFQELLELVQPGAAKRLQAREPSARRLILPNIGVPLVTGIMEGPAHLLAREVQARMVRAVSVAAEAASLEVVVAHIVILDTI